MSNATVEAGPGTPIERRRNDVAAMVGVGAIHFMMFALTLAFFYLIVPHFRRVFMDFHTALPGLTQWTLTFSDFVGSWIGCWLLPMGFLCDLGLTVLVFFVLGRRWVTLWTALVATTWVLVLGTLGVSIGLAFEALVTSVR